MSLNRLFARRLGGATLSLCAAAVLSACGGGDRAEPYVPTRLVAFGDELSVIEEGVDANNPPQPRVTATNTVTGAPTSSGKGNGVKYTVNGFNSAGELDCTINPIWVQILAADFGMAFKECAGTYTTFAAESRAYKGAKTADVVARMVTLRTATPVTSGTLVTVQVGMNDVIDLAAQVAAGLAERDATARIEALAVQLTTEINNGILAGMGILVATIPDVSYAPYPAKVGLDTGLMHRLTWAFNQKLRNTLPSDGHKVALVSGTPSGFSTGTSNTGDYTVASGYTNARNCVAGINTPNCTTSTLNDAGNSNNFIWADDLYPGPFTHSNMGSTAYTLVRNSLAPGQ